MVVSEDGVSVGFFGWVGGERETYEVVEEETVVERETCVVECERLARVRRGRDDNLCDALIFEPGA